MKNIIEQFRQEKGLTCAALGRTCGLTKAAVSRHCKGERNIGAESVLRYHVMLGIPLELLRPDLFRQTEAVEHSVL